MSCQQGILYEAEEAVSGAEAILPSSLQAYVDSLRDFPWWERNFPQVVRIEAYERPVGVYDSVGSWQADGNCGVIEMGVTHLNELFVIHEVCHVLAAARYGSHAHDPWFARTYLEAVSVYAPHLYLPLWQEFIKKGVDFDVDASNPGGIAL